ncbi:MAG TPA: hypothetical protein VGH80_14465 [Xanthomonadaceae bacterium]
MARMQTIHLKAEYTTAIDSLRNDQQAKRGYLQEESIHELLGTRGASKMSWLDHC